MNTLIIAASLFLADEAAVLKFDGGVEVTFAPRLKTVYVSSGKSDPNIPLQHFEESHYQLINVTATENGDLLTPQGSGYFISGKLLTPEFKSGNTKLLTIDGDKDPDFGQAFRFNGPGAVPVICKLGTKTAKVSIKVIRLNVTEGDTLERVTKSLGKPDDTGKKTKALNQLDTKFENVTVTEIQWRWKKHPGAVVVFHDAKVFRIETEELAK